jgi:outer membrane usher protein
MRKAVDGGPTHAMRIPRLWAGSLLLCVALSSAGAPARAEVVMPVKALDVVLNGQDTGEVLDFKVEAGGLAVAADDLRRLGFLLPEGESSVLLSRIVGLRWMVDERRQIINLNAGRGVVRAAKIDLSSNGPAPAAQVSPGALINYNLVATDTRGHTALTGELEARAFGPWGVLESTALVATDASRILRRLDTSWSLADPGRMRRYVIGDLVSGGLAWTRPVRMAGVQVSSDFTMRPDLVTFPTPTLKGDVAAASTVDVFVNGEQRYSGPVAGGAFDLASVPVLTGANQISMVVTDATGRRTVESLPFYSSSVLLAPGLTSFDAEAGLLRQGYGGLDDSYATLAASFSARFGLAPALTVEAHGEGAPKMVEAGGGASLDLGYGVLTLAAAGSVSGSSAGGYFDAAIERVASRFSVAAGVEGVTGDYHDLASFGGEDFPRLRTRLQAGLPLGGASAFNAAYVHTFASADQRIPSGDALAVSYSHTLGHGVSMSASAYANQGVSRGTSIFLTVTAMLGGRSFGLSALSTGGSPIFLAQAAKPWTGLDQTEWHMAAQSGQNPQVLAEIGRQTGFGQFSAGVDKLGDATAFQASASGSVVLMDRHLFVAKAIDNSFAVVEAGAPGVTVYDENRVVGRSDASGRLLVADLRPYQSNALGLNANEVPFDMALQTATLTVDPLARTGVVARFPTRAVAEALIVLVDTEGRPLPVGSRVADGSPKGAVVGFDGEALATGLKAHNSLAVRTDDGRACIARFDYAPAKGAISRIGPVTCKTEPFL